MASDSETKNFFLRPPRGPQRSHFGQQNASASMLSMICCNHGLMGDFMGAFYRPLIPSQTRCFVGPPRLSRGPGPPRAPRNSTTASNSTCNTRSVLPPLWWSTGGYCLLSKPVVNCNVTSASVYVRYVWFYGALQIWFNFNFNHCTILYSPPVAFECFTSKYVWLYHIDGKVAK